ncbi:alpha/beta hydrolase family protein [Phaeobacter piscinae]|uniref:alpha/beta hydrolase family protein n=1 Tax=Phaeobacter piscinae TaxID=1580596 RepID=UPI000BBF0B23|nr:dienelactone hydrolase [Phaeobacter piscinae]ATG40959.1 putative dienelactone hydrolase [Phaeobacter piscinae]
MAVCGYRSGVIKDASRSNWHNNSERPIAWSAWYPIEDLESGEQTSGQFFELGDVKLDAALTTRKRLPVVLLSHGTGGTAESLGWLARALAGEGYVVLGANHHGNTGLEPYLAEGFLCWWERATDLSVMLSSLGTSGFFADRLDFDQVSAVGFSLGGYTVMALAGAQTSLEEFEGWRSANGISEGGPKEFPNAADSISTLTETSDAFRRSWAEHGRDRSDNRIKSVVAIAPALPIRSFTPQSVAEIELPVVILTGGADNEAPSEHCGDWLVSQNARFQRHDLGKQVGHYTFLDFPSDKSLVGKAHIFSDHDSVDRNQVHEQAAEIVMQSLAASESKGSD